MAPRAGSPARPFRMGAGPCAGKGFPRPASPRRDQDATTRGSHIPRAAPGGGGRGAKRPAGQGPEGAAQGRRPGAGGPGEAKPAARGGAAPTRGARRRRERSEPAAPGPARGAQRPGAGAPREAPTSLPEGRGRIHPRSGMRKRTGPQRARPAGPPGQTCAPPTSQRRDCGAPQRLASMAHSAGGPEPGAQWAQGAALRRGHQDARSRNPRRPGAGRYNDTHGGLWPGKPRGCGKALVAPTASLQAQRGPIKAPVPPIKSVSAWGRKPEGEGGVWGGRGRTDARLPRQAAETTSRGWALLRSASRRGSRSASIIGTGERHNLLFVTEPFIFSNNRRENWTWLYYIVTMATR